MGPSPIRGNPSYLLRFRFAVALVSDLRLEISRMLVAFHFQLHRFIYVECITVVNVKIKVKAFQTLLAIQDYDLTGHSIKVGRVTHDSRNLIRAPIQASLSVLPALNSKLVA